VNVLERRVEEELTRVPSGPSGRELRRRVRVRRARHFGAVGAVAIVFAVLGIATMLQSPDRHRVQVTQPAPTEPTTTSTAPASKLPLATTTEFPPLEKIINSVTGSVRSNTDPKAVVANPSSTQIVATTRDRAYAVLRGGTRGVGTGEDRIYVVQVIGGFSCRSCTGPLNAPPERGSVLVETLEANGEGTIFGIGVSPTPYDLSTLGTVYRLELTPLATTEQIPELAKMAEIASNNVRSDDRSGPGSAHPTSGEIVETTRARAFSLLGGSLQNLDAQIYVVQVIGDFRCAHCSRPPNAVEPHGRALRLVFDAAGNGYQYGLGGAYDLSTLGTVYRIRLSG
jgi:hypothetical protein